MDRWVQRTADEYAQAIEGELPQGAAWSRDPNGGLMKWVNGCAQIWGDVSEAAADLLVVESDPQQTIAMLPDWERNFGLPDPCSVEAQTLETRRTALLTRMTMQGGQSISFFENLATSLGYEISIYEYLPVACGLSQCGDTRPNGETTFEWARCGGAQSGVDHICNIELNAGDDWIWRLGPPELRYYWRVSILHTRLTWLRCGLGECGVDPMCAFGLASDLQCLIQRWKPGHTFVIFDYSQLSTSN
jgi:uncharacterized protein YmfQ (DUF2313 family)